MESRRSRAVDRAGERGPCRITGRRGPSQSGRRGYVLGRVKEPGKKSAKALEDELVRRVQEAPVNADLNALLARGTILGEPIDSVPGALYSVSACRRSDRGLDKGIPQQQGESDEAHEVAAEERADAPTSRDRAAVQSRRRAPCSESI